MSQTSFSLYLYNQWTDFHKLSCAGKPQMRAIRTYAGKLKLSEVPEKPWMHLTVDFIMKLSVVARKDVILVVCDRLFKMTHFVATTEGTSAEGLARLFRDNVWKLHRLLESVMSDRGPQFAVELMKELNRLLGIEIVFYPQRDGQIEWINQELE